LWWGWELCERMCAKLGHVSMICDGVLFIPRMEHSSFWFLINLLSLVVTFMKVLNLGSHWTLDIMDFIKVHMIWHLLYITLQLFSLICQFLGILFPFSCFFCLLIFGIFFIYHILIFFHYFSNYWISFFIFWFLLLADLLSFIQFFWFYMVCQC
jgi:hypothetical protein